MQLSYTPSSKASLFDNFPQSLEEYVDFFVAERVAIGVLRGYAVNDPVRIKEYILQAIPKLHIGCKWSACMNVQVLMEFSPEDGLEVGSAELYPRLNLSIVPVHCGWDSTLIDAQ